MTYRGLSQASDPEAPHLGGNIKGGDPFTYCPSVWNYVISRFGIESVLDLGSGNGNASLYFHKKGLKVVSIDGLSQNVDISLFPCIKHDITAAPVHTKVDLVHCHEVVEHIEEKYIDNLLSSLLTGKVVLMTHALPGQGGYHHVNEQPTFYWMEKMQGRNCSFLEEDTRRVRSLAKHDGATYMANSGLIFINNSRV